MGLLEDARNIQRKDPAARSVLEVILLYPGFHILVYHRIAHWLYQHKRFFLARWVSQHGRRRTGIEIHPGATIGRCLFIDHGMGIVFGETCEIGDNCTIYHGVTLGGTGKDTGKRHPTLGNNVLIGAGTKVLGPVFIGDNARVGAGSVVLHNLPANCTAVGVPAEVVRINNKAIVPLGRPRPAGPARCHRPAPHRAGPPHQRHRARRPGRHPPYRRAAGQTPEELTLILRCKKQVRLSFLKRTCFCCFRLFTACGAQLFYFLSRSLHQLADGPLRHADHEVLAVVHRDEHPLGVRLTKHAQLIRHKADQRDQVQHQYLTGHGL